MGGVYDSSIVTEGVIHDKESTPTKIFSFFINLRLLIWVVLSSVTQVNCVTWQIRLVVDESVVIHHDDGLVIEVVEILLDFAPTCRLLNQNTAEFCFIYFAVICNLTGFRLVPYAAFFCLLLRWKIFSFYPSAILLQTCCCLLSVSAVSFSLSQILENRVIDADRAPKDPNVCSKIIVFKAHWPFGFWYIDGRVFFKLG